MQIEHDPQNESKSILIPHLFSFEGANHSDLNLSRIKVKIAKILRLISKSNEIVQRNGSCSLQKAQQ